jgi:hypothetical protein
MSENGHTDVEPKEEQGQTALATPLVSLAEQIGQHTMAALSQTSTVAVLTTVTGSANGKQIVSLPLDRSQLQNIQMLLAQVEQSEQPADIECVGFHCDFRTTD